VNDIWSAVRTERGALADDLTDLPSNGWSTSSLCEGWDIHDVLAHLVDSAKETRLRFCFRLARARFDFDRANARGLAGERAADPAATLAAFRAVVDRTTTPPGPKETRLVEAFVHGEDIRRPLGIARVYPAPLVVRAVEFQARTSASMGGGRTLVAGTKLVASDADLDLGAGPRVEGPAISILLAASGRRAALDDLSGEGVDLIARRLADDGRR
jgi:uncharacterized protein (TIGR03083 family)